MGFHDLFLSYFFGGKISLYDLYGQSDLLIDEESLFGEEETVLTNEETDKTDINDTDLGMSYTGFLYHRSLLSMGRNAWQTLFDEGTFWEQSSFVHFLQADLFFDLRLEKGAKAFVSFSVLIKSLSR